MFDGDASGIKDVGHVGLDADVARSDEPAAPPHV